MQIPVPIGKSLQQAVKRITRSDDLSSNLWEALFSVVQLRQLPAHTFLWRVEHPVEHIAFLNQGVIRSYFQKEEIEMNIGLNLPGEFVCDYQGLLTGQGCFYEYQVLENAELLLIAKPDYENLITRFSFWRDFMSKIMLDEFCRLTTIQQKYIAETPEHQVGIGSPEGHQTATVSLESLADMLDIPREKLPIFFGTSKKDHH